MITVNGHCTVNVFHEILWDGRLGNARSGFVLICDEMRMEVR